jgi:hypothetical protein
VMASGASWSICVVLSTCPVEVVQPSRANRQRQSDDTTNAKAMRVRDKEWLDMLIGRDALHDSG